MKAKQLQSLIKYSSLSVRSLFVTSFFILEAVLRQSIHFFQFKKIANERGSAKAQINENH